MDHPLPLSLSRPAPVGVWLRLDVWLFRRLGAGTGPAGFMAVARAVARHSLWALLALVLLVAATRPGAWALALAALLHAGLAQWVAKRCARRWTAQRPFALGLCPNHLGHAGRAGFPSSHAIVMGAVWGALAPHAGDPLSAAIAAVALATAWARVHTGAHFALDVIVGLAVGAAWGGLLGAWPLD